MHVVAPGILFVAALLTGCGREVSDKGASGLDRGSEDAASSVDAGSGGVRHAGGGGGRAGHAEAGPSEAGADGAGGAHYGDGGRRPLDGGAPPDPPEAGAPEEGGAATCRIHEAETLLAPEDCEPCMGTEAACVDVLGNPFDVAACAFRVENLIMYCSWFPSCDAPHSFSAMVTCPVPTGCILCMVNF